MILTGEGIGIFMRDVSQVQESGFWNLLSSTIGGMEMDLRSFSVREYIYSSPSNFADMSAGAGKSFMTLDYSSNYADFKVNSNRSSSSVHQQPQS